MLIWKFICTPMFTAGSCLFTIDKIQKQLNHSLTDERIKKMWYISYWSSSALTYIQWNVIAVVQASGHVWTPCDSMDCSTPGLPLPEFAQVHVHYSGDAVQPSFPLTPSSPSALNLPQHQGLFQWIICSHQMIKILELQHQSFQWIFKADLP